MREEDLAPFDGGGEGLYHRFYDAVQRETTIDGILAAAKSKRYAYARLRRLLLAAYLGVTPGGYPAARALSARAGVQCARAASCSDT